MHNLANKGNRCYFDMSLDPFLTVFFLYTSEIIQFCY